MSQQDEGLSKQQKAVITTKAKHGEDFYKKIGSQAGKASPSSPFRDQPGLASRAVKARWEKYYAKKAALAATNPDSDTTKK